MKQYDWTSNRMDTVHTLRVYENGKIVARVPKLDWLMLEYAVKELEANGYMHKD